MMWGWIFVIAGFLFFFVYRLTNRQIGLIVLAAFILRAVAAVLHQYLFTLPAGCCDAVVFEKLAWSWSMAGEATYYSLFNPSQTYVLSWLGASVYSVFGRDPFLLQMLNVFLGTVSVIVVYKTAKELMPEKFALIPAWLFALHPTLIEQSAVFLREAVIVLFFALSIYYFVRWVKTLSPVHVLLSVLFMVVCSVFHGGMVFGLFALSLAVFLIIFRNSFITLQSRKVKRGFLPTLLIVIAGVFIVFTFIEIPRIAYIGDLQNLFTLSELTERTSYALEVRQMGTAVYLEWLTVSSPLDLVWQTPIRLAYFLYSPFPWDITEIRHIKGFIDSGFMLYITYLVVKFRKELWGNPIYRYLFILLIICTVVYSFGTTNFGTAIRHKAKFLPLIVLFYGLKANTQK